MNIHLAIASAQGTQIVVVDTEEKAAKLEAIGAIRLAGAPLQPQAAAPVQAVTTPAAAVTTTTTTAPAAAAPSQAQASNLPAINVTVNTADQAKKTEVEKKDENKLKFLDPKQLKPETLLAMTAGGQYVDFNEAVAQAPAVQAKLDKTHALIGLVAVEVVRSFVNDRNAPAHAPMPALN